MTHILKLLDKMYKYEMDPTRTVGATERTQDAGQTDGRSDTNPPQTLTPVKPRRSLSCSCWVWKSSWTGSGLTAAGFETGSSSSCSWWKCITRSSGESSCTVHSGHGNTAWQQKQEYPCMFRINPLCAKCFRGIINIYLHMGQDTELWLSCYLVLLSTVAPFTNMV